MEFLNLSKRLFLRRPSDLPGGIAYEMITKRSTTRWVWGLMLTLLITAVAPKLQAQTTAVLHQAFATSIEHEMTGNLDQAISVLQPVYNERSYELNIRMGWLHYQMGAHRQSVTFYQRAARLMPVATEPLWGLVGPQVALEQWNDVDATYLAILRIDPKNSVANYRLGLNYFYRMNYRLAKRYFDVTLNLFPFDYDALLMSGWTHFYLGNTREARVLFNKVLMVRPGDASATEGLSMIR
jgi:tetratricopeptide (TPR) repeat protein